MILHVIDKRAVYMLPEPCESPVLLFSVGFGNNIAPILISATCAKFAQVDFSYSSPSLKIFQMLDNNRSVNAEELYESIPGQPHVIILYRTSIPSSPASRVNTRKSTMLFLICKLLLLPIDRHILAMACLRSICFIKKDAVIITQYVL